MTKQAETREQVLDLIEQLSIGDAIPSERTAEHGPRRLAADRASCARRARPRGLPRPPARRRDVRQRAEDRPGADHDLFHRGHAAARSEPGEPHSRAPFCSRRCTPRAHPPRLTVGAGRRRDAPPARRSRDDGDRGAPRPPIARSRSQRARSRGAFVLRAPPGALRNRGRHRAADRRADGHRARRSRPLSVCRSTRQHSSSSG